LRIESQADSLVTFMVLIEVASLLEDGAQIDIEGTAVL
jgi:hypothetical protein